MNKDPKVKIATLGIALMLSQVVRAQVISDFAKSDPLIITGAVGTQNTYHYSSVGDGYASPLSNTLYANLNVNLYGISMPFSFYYSNSTTSFSYPQFSFNLTPQYKNWTGHIGQSNMAFSNYVLNMSWNGVGLEYNSDRMRVGAFYGILRQAINDDPSEPFARAPQYKRIGWGFKIGYGTKKNYIDLYLLRAYDRLNSLHEEYREIVAPEENIVIGLKGCVAPVKWATLSANVATSIFNTDTRAEKIKTTEATKWDNVFDVTYSSLMRFAGDATLNLTLPFGVNTTLSYRMVEPDYRSLGAYYMSNNYQAFNATLSTILFRKVAFSGMISAQSDNITKKQMYTTNGYVYNVGLSTRIGENLNLSLSYNGYTQNQTDGTCTVNDTTRVNRRMGSLSFTPSYNFDGETLSHLVSLSLNLTENKDLNPFSNHTGDVNTKAIGLSYGVDVKPWELDLGLALSHQETEGYNTKYKSEVATISASRSFFEEKNFTLSGNLNLCYNEVYRQSKSLSMGGDLSVGYTHKKVHTFSASASFNKYGDVNITNTHSNLDCLDVSCSLNYAYTFTLLELRRKSK